jgi:uncharacterized membrane protein
MIKKWKTSFAIEDSVAAGLIGLGGLLRLRQYLTGRSLWLDEAMLASSVVNRGFAGLFQPLEYGQGSPIGFLLVEKVFHLLFGRNEYSLRLFPLLVGIASVGLFYLLLKRLTRGPALLTVLALFALNPRLIYYSSEVKQYILDVAFTVGILLLAVRLFDIRPQRRDFLLLAVVGFAALWFSHPALFVLAGVGLSLAIVYIRRRDYSSLKLAAAVGVFWLVTFGILYVLLLKRLQQDAFMQEYWQTGFLPIPPWSDAGWFAENIRQNIGLQFGIPYATYIVFGLILVGWVMLWHSDQNFAICLGLIFLITLGASALKLYPVIERMILFLVPVGLLLLGTFVEAVHRRFQSNLVADRFSVVLIATFLIYGPLTTSFGSFMQPKYYEHIRPAMGYLQEMWQNEDVMYVSYGAVPAFKFYAPMYSLSNVNYISNGRQDYNDPPKILQQLETLQGHQRVWVLISHVYEKDGFNEKDFILDYLKKAGDKKREFRVPGSSVYLYLFDLGK